MAGCRSARPWSAPPARADAGLRQARLAVKSDLADLFLAEFEIEVGYEGPGLHEHEAEVDAFYVLDASSAC